MSADVCEELLVKMSLSMLLIYHVGSGVSYLEYFPPIPLLSSMVCPVFLETELDSRVCSIHLPLHLSAGSSFHRIFMNFMF